MSEHPGGCLCGGVRFVDKGEIKGVEACHCSQCRRWTSGAYFSVRFANKVSIQGDVRWFKSSDYAERGSCATCGTPLFWRMQDEDDAAVSAGAVDDQSALKAMHEHIFVDDQPAWLVFADGAPRITNAEMHRRFDAFQQQQQQQ